MLNNSESIEISADFSDSSQFQEVYNGNYKIIEILIKSGLDINVLGSGTTPLCWAVTKENIDVALYLLNQGSDGLLASENFPTPVDCYEEQLGKDFKYLYNNYGISEISSLLENSESLGKVTPELPTSLEALILSSGI